MEDRKISRGNREKMNEISDQVRRDIDETFSMFDPENKRSIESSKLKMAMRALGFEPKKEEVKKIINEYDKDNEGVIAYDDFLNLMSKKISEKDANDEIMRAFQLFDDKNTGKIGFESLKRVSEELGENISEEELKEMIAEADRDGDGYVDKAEFLRIMKKTCLY
ncbi:uncharacterized protein LOC141858753 [Brevipalpus obovatus]|uniref:uncharacterized protein LOC141858753 n=1 Tax=Brevipalpus obovatus TaxID=246614 RepID=UPI003D9E5EDB